MARREAEDITENAPMANLPLVVQPLQVEVVSVAEVTGASSDCIEGAGVVETLQTMTHTETHQLEAVSCSSGEPG